ncbi:copper amine oxidase N-terminal domain-containing protein [Paenibacillus sp. P25]|nr:copper amine oxidase N-terminal domain-containing protein [Paenibacillus sp. P25]
MKKRYGAITRKMAVAAGLVAVLAGSAAVQAEGGLTAVASKFPVWAGGKRLQTDKDPVIIDGSLYLPLRSFGEALGKQIDWNDWNQSVSVKDMPAVKAKAELKNPAPLGKGINEGGFSGLTHLPGDPDDIFYTLGDRGPNGQVGKEQTSHIPDRRFQPAHL